MSYFDDVQQLSPREMNLLDMISPEFETRQTSTFYPILVSLFVAVLAWGITSSYFTNVFKGVQYLPFIQAGIIFSVVLVSILFLT